MASVTELPTMGASITEDHVPEQQGLTFHEFFEKWITEQDSFLQELISAASIAEEEEEENQIKKNPLPPPLKKKKKNIEEQERVFHPLINRVIDHYEAYYRVKSRWVHQDVLTMLSPSWRTTLEDAFLWIGGWRPTMAFHLLYSKSGLQLGDRLNDIIRGLTTADLGDLSSGQLSRIDELQRRTVREEKELTEKMAKQQETVADSSMVELSGVVSEMLRRNGSIRPGEVESERVEEVLKPKEEGFERVLERADDLRLRTLKGVVEILTPIQTVHFLISAAELHLRLHDWGKKKDECNQSQSQRCGVEGGHQSGTHHHDLQREKHRHLGGSSTTTASSPTI